MEGAGSRTVRQSNLCELTRGGRASIARFFAPGEGYQFDGSHEVVLIDSVTGHLEGCPSPAMHQLHDVRDGLSWV